MNFSCIRSRALNRHMKQLTISIVLSFIVTSGIAANEQLVVYAELEETANYVSGSENPVPIGPAYRLVLAVLAEAGYEPDIRVVPWPRVVHSLESQDNVLGFSMTRTPDREDRFHWIGQIQKVNFKLWAPPESAADFPETLDAATDLRISAIRGDVVENYLMSKGFTNLIYFSESSNTLTMLRRDRVDLMPYIESGIESYLARKNESSDTLVPIYDLEDTSTGQYIVMSKQSDPELVQLLQNSYHAVIGSGDFDNILNLDQD